jgi:putative two-component system response regulator
MSDKMLGNDHKQARIAIVDDEPINIKVVRKYLQVAGYGDFVTTTDSTAAADLIRRQQPDVVLLDIMMPQVDGIQILAALRADEKTRHLPVLILTASTDAQTKLRALEAGATDFLPKPVDPNDLIPRLRNALIVKAHHDHLARYAGELEREVRIRTAELEASQLQIIYCLARAGECRDENTGRHVLRVGRYAEILAREMGIPSHHARLIGLAAQLHDVGKIGVPDAILNKPGKLTPEEFAQIKKHCADGAQIVRPLSEDEWGALRSQETQGIDTPALGSPPLLVLVQRIVSTHHERWDGKGYPAGLAGEAIPVEGRITSVADVLDALTSKRPYKEAMDVSQSLKIITDGAGTQFDPNAVQALLRGLDQILAVMHSAPDPVPEQAAAAPVLATPRRCRRVRPHCRLIGCGGVLRRK